MLTDLANTANHIAKQCGNLIVDERPVDLGVADTKSSAVDIVTVMDRKSEQLAHQLVSEARPDDGLLGEEGLDIESKTGITWVIDPIDATVNYFYNIPAFAVSVAAIVGDARTPGAWKPVVGAVYNPALKELFSAVHGQGAHLTSPSFSGQISPNPQKSLAQSLVATGFNYSAEVRALQGQAFAELIPQVRDIRRSGCAALDLCHVAMGRLDAYYETGLKVWDFAAGWLIATEAGCHVAGLNPDYPHDDFIVAGHPELCQYFTQLTKKHKIYEAL